MRVLSDEAGRGDSRGSIVTIGVFDGVHRGHQAILTKVVAEAQRALLAGTVVTFDPHPARVLDPLRAPLQLETVPRRLARLELLGLDQVRVIGFDEAASRETADEFVARVLVGELGAQRIVVGEDFRFGKGRAGDVARLTTLGQQHGFSVESVAPVGASQRYSSTGARAHVQRGDLPGAEAVLGHRVVVSGEVVHGDARGGGELGFPTANLQIGSEYVQPGEGVYAGAVRRANGAWYATAVSIGRRPQFYLSGEVTVEAFLVEFHGDLYGEQLDLVLLEFLRGEARFASVSDLVVQMDRDVAAAIEIYRALPVNDDSLLGFELVQRR